MDSLDKKIVLELMHDCRKTHAEIAARVGGSVSQVRARLKKLEQKRIIENYVTELAANVFREGFIFSYVRIVKTKGRDARQFLTNNVSGFLYYIEDLGGDYALFFDYEDMNDLKKKTALLNSQSFISTISHFVFPFKKRSDVITRLEKIDWLLIKALRRNSKLTYKQLGKDLHISPKLVGKKIRFLKEQGLVNFTINFNPLNVKNHAVSFLLVELDENTKNNLTRLLETCEPYSFFPVWFELPPAFLITLVTPSMNEVQEISNRLNAFEGVLSVRPIVWKEFTRGPGWMDQVIESYMQLYSS
ncbi:MAG: Lrp/AsnC family transcriptional regulator [Candidatus Helarchaeota archaeon]